MPNLTSVINQLHQERKRLSTQLQHVTNAISALNGISNNRAGRKGISAAGRARIAAAQRARWAKFTGKVVSIATKRTMSPVARKRIAAAQRARWAEWRKRQKR